MKIKRHELASNLTTTRLLHATGDGLCGDVPTLKQRMFSAMRAPGIYATLHASEILILTANL